MPSLLVVDDEPGVRESLRMLFKGDCEVSAASNVEEAEAYLADATPDLILLDLRLPKVDGLEVLAEIKKTTALQAVPVVIMTASEDKADRLKCESFHVDAYVQKPVNLQKFQALMRQLRDFWQNEELILPAV